MKKVLLFLLCFLQMTAHAQEYRGIHFEQELSWEQVKAKARAEDKYIFVDIYTTWCGPCKMMDQQVYSYWRIGDNMKDKFISIKVQMDSTASDNEQVKSWYVEAKKFSKEYKISGYPTLLFFSPEGVLVQNEAGFQKKEDFMRLTQLARDPQRPLYYGRYESYKVGKKDVDYKTMGGLAIFTKNLIGDKAISDSIAKDYKENYLDKLPEDSLCSREYLDFIGWFPDLMESGDKLFDLCYHQPDRVDKVKDYNGWSKHIVERTIIREEIADKVLKNGIPVKRYPRWNNLQDAIAEKYGVIDAKHLVLNYQILYYSNLYVNWRLWAKYRDEEIKSYPPHPPYGLDVYIRINGGGGAWLAFLKCNDKKVLKKALEWADLAISLEGPTGPYLDTKANLLYKLGERDAALALEKRAVAVAPKDAELADNYKKMEEGEPTWVVSK